MRESDRFLPIEMAVSGQNAEWRITIYDWVPDSRLHLNGRHRTHWGTIQTCKAQTKRRVREFLDDFPDTKSITFASANVAITFEYPQKRRRDPDNLAGLVKPIMDALVDAGILLDDDCDHVELTIRARTTGRHATTVEIHGPVADEVVRQAVLLEVARRDEERPKPRKKKAAPSVPRGGRVTKEELEALPY